MAVFHYRFERILNIKAHQEQELQQELLIVQREILQRQKQLQHIAEEESEIQHRIRQALSGTISVSHIQALKNEILILEKKKEFMNQEIEKLYELKRKKQTELVEAMRERKKYEKLRERKLQEFMQEEARREQYEQDEMGQSLFIQNKQHTEV